MLLVSDSIKKAYDKYTTQRKSYITVGENSFFVQNLDVSADAYNEGNVIGNAIAKIVKFDIETVNIKEIDEFELFDGIWTGNQYEYVSLGTFKLFDEEGTDDFFSSVVAYDKLVYFNKEYDPSKTSFPTTLYGLLQNICLQAGVDLENISLPNGHQQISGNLFIENETLKTILNAICQINGCFAVISQDKLKLLLKGTETINLSKYQLSNPEYKRTTWNINQVILGMADVEGEYVKYPDDSQIQGSIHKLVINDNPFVYTQELRQAYMQNLYNQVNDFGYVAFETKWEGLPYIELGDLINIDGRESIVLRYNLKSPQGLNSSLSAPSIIDSVVEYVDNSNSILNRQKKTEIIVDKQNQNIKALSSQTIDTTKTETGIGSVTIDSKLDNVGYQLTIRNACQLFPSSKLYPSSTLYPLGRWLRVTYADGTYSRCKLPVLALRQLNDVCDEMIITSGKVQVIKRIGVNADESLYLLDEPITTDKEDVDIVLKQGINKIELESFPNANLTMQYMIESIYSNTFSTKKETSAEIEVMSNQINLQVAQKVDGKEYTKANIIAKINDDTSEAQINADVVKLSANDILDLIAGNVINLTSKNITIASDNFTVDKLGNIFATGGKIGGWNIGKDYLWCEIKPPYDYTQSDVDRIQQIVLGDITPTANDYAKYDIDSNGVIDIFDMLQCKKFLIYNLQNSNPGKLLLDTADWFRPIKIINSAGEILTSFGVTGVVTKEIEEE